MNWGEITSDLDMQTRGKQTPEQIWRAQWRELAVGAHDGQAIEKQTPELDWMRLESKDGDAQIKGKQEPRVRALVRRYKPANGQALARIGLNRNRTPEPVIYSYTEEFDADGSEDTIPEVVFHVLVFGPSPPGSATGFEKDDITVSDDNPCCHHGSPSTHPKALAKVYRMT